MRRFVRFTLSRMLLLSATLLLASGCAKEPLDEPSHEPWEDDAPDTRPGSSDEDTPQPQLYDFSPELDDACPRAIVKDSEPQLRYDSAGVLVMQRAEHEWMFVDIDTSRNLSFGYTSVNPDSTLVDAHLEILSTPHPLLSARCEQLDARAGWYNLLTADSLRIVIVTPIF